MSAQESADEKVLESIFPDELESGLMSDRREGGRELTARTQ